MKINLILFFSLLSVIAGSQSIVTSKNIKIDFSGFVRNDFILDSRRIVCACDHLLEFYPQRPQYDELGRDINARANAHLLNTFTRFGTRFTGLEMGGAAISGYVEVDFTGFSETNGLRFRHAYTHFAWPKAALLIGRAWHPTFIEKVYPSVLNENTGLPFQVFNRSPQVRLTYHLTGNLDLITGAVYQFNYANHGPDGKTYRYQREAVLPNLHGQLQFFNEHWVIGAAVDWKSILPRISTTGSGGIFRTTEKLNTWAAIAYMKYTKEKFEFKAKTMYGQNVSESLLPGGYAVSSRDAETGFETYTPLNHIYNWINFTYGRALKAGFYAGYMKNMGTSDMPVGPFYGIATDIDMIGKISPQLLYTYKNLMLGWELSITTAAYGNIDMDNFGRVINSENVTNFRNMASVVYSF